MRVDVTKVLFIGAASKKQEFLHSFQKAGFAQFIGTKVTVADLLSCDFQDSVQAIKILKSYAVEQTPNVSIVDPVSFSHRIVDEKASLDELRSQLAIDLELSEYLSPIGQIPLKQIHFLEKNTAFQLRLWTALKKKNMGESHSFLIDLASTQHRQYFISFSKEELSPPEGLEAIPITNELAILPDRIRQTRMKISIIEQELKRKAPLITSLKKALVTNINQTKRKHVSQQALRPLDDSLFAMTAWIPNTSLSQAKELSYSLNIFSDELSADKNEIPPTHLENKALSKMGEDLISIYDTPSHTDKDPSLFVLIFFSLFFAMIIGDGGYGAVFLITALLLRKKASSPSAKRTVQLTGLLGIMCIVWGLCTSSFFAIKISPDNPLKKYSPITYLVKKQGLEQMQHMDNVSLKTWRQHHAGMHPKSLHDFLYERFDKNSPTLAEKIQDKILMELSILVGALHIIIGLLRYARRNISHLGWVLAIIGGYLYCANYLEANSLLYYLLHLNPAESAFIGLELIGTGILFALFASLIQNGISGLAEIMTIVQLFGDILSYLRIYALALAGSMIGSMANEMAENMPFIIALFLITLSHAVNIVMSVVGGVIHGLRLNFLEWYHYSFEGGGKQFYPFKLETYQ